jgi:protein-L-isoaspartate(D-aspartate) O-methyltransferase
MYKIPRHFFFDPAFLEHAYQDKAFPIDAGQTISQPFTVARQTELLEIQAGDKVLEIGTGSGYQCAVLCELGVRAHSIEYVELLHKKAAQMLRLMGYQPTLFCGDGTKGLPQYAPFNKILVTAGAPVVPDLLLKQLGNNGILVVPIGDQQKQRMVRFRKLPNGSIIEEDHGVFSFVPLLGHQGWKP